MTNAVQALLTLRFTAALRRSFCALEDVSVPEA
jgi:hypothetical protein